jgi:hypothetical protein
MRKIPLAIIMASLAVMAAPQGQSPATQKGQALGAPPAGTQAVETTVTGILAFVGDAPAVKTDGGTVLLSMPDFFKYAYAQGFKAGISVKATGFLSQGQQRADTSAKAGQSMIIAKEVVIGNTTFIIVGGVPGGRPGGSRVFEAPDDGKQPRAPGKDKQTSGE